MKAILLFALLFSLSSFGATQKLKIKVQHWTQNCAKSVAGESSQCDLPQALGQTQDYFLNWTESNTEGDASSSSVKIFVDDNKHLAKLTLFHVFPRLDSNQPKYLQLRWEWILPQRGLCIESVRQRKPLELPPVMCAVWNEKDKRMHGATITFEDLTEL